MFKMKTSKTHKKENLRLQKKLNSLSLFIGSSQCNAKCSHCAGIPLRKDAPKKDGIIDEELIGRTVRDCYTQGARYLSISSSGEPTLSPKSVSRTLEIIEDLKKEGVSYSPINLYSNGIRIGNDKGFCKTYLPQWSELGLSTFYITVHDIDSEKNAKIYGIKKYPSLGLIVNRIHDAGIKMRANLVLSKKTISDFEKFKLMVEQLKEIGVDKISAWPIRTLDDKIDYSMSPLKNELEQMEEWSLNRTYSVKVLLEKTKIAYSSGQKLTLFPNGKLSNTWCN